MQRLWSAPELGEHWRLDREDLQLLAGLPDAGKLGLAAQLAYWRQHGRFPDEEADLAPAVVAHLAAQVGVHAHVLEGYEWTGRTGRRHRRVVLDHLAVAAFDDAAEARFRHWLAADHRHVEVHRPALPNCRLLYSLPVVARDTHDVAQDRLDELAGGGLEARAAATWPCTEGIELAA